jgi:hypothetical protein
LAVALSVAVGPRGFAKRMDVVLTLTLNAQRKIGEVRWKTPAPLPGLYDMPMPDEADVPHHSHWRTP